MRRQRRHLVVKPLEGVLGVGDGVPGRRREPPGGEEAGVQHRRVQQQAAIHSLHPQHGGLPGPAGEACRRDSHMNQDWRCVLAGLEVERQAAVGR